MTLPINEIQASVEPDAIILLSCIEHWNELSRWSPQNHVMTTWIIPPWNMCNIMVIVLITWKEALESIIAKYKQTNIWQWVETTEICRQNNVGYRKNEEKKYDQLPMWEGIRYKQKQKCLPATMYVSATTMFISIYSEKHIWMMN